jgi:Tfp pilus assembly protein PilP
VVLVSTGCWIGALFVSPDLAIAQRSYDIPTTLSSTLHGPYGTVKSRIELHGSVILYESPASRKPIPIKPTSRQWREFRKAIDELNVWEWQSESDRSVTDSGGWTLNIEYSDRSMRPKPQPSDVSKDTSSRDCSALAADPFTHFRAAVQRLLGDRPFGQRVTPLELFPLSQLKLVRTHPAARDRDQWADFRVPNGRTYRVWRYLFDCCNRAVSVGTAFGTLHEVKSNSVSIAEVCQDPQREWYEREIVKALGE